MAVCTDIVVLSIMSVIVALQGIIIEQFSLVADRKLDHHKYSRIDARSMLDCGIHCSMETQCMSFNFHQEQREMAGMCDLNNAVGRRDNLTVAMGYIYGYEMDASTPEDQQVVYMQLQLYAIPLQINLKVSLAKVIIVL
jgi:hypothetical protein